MKEPNDGDGPAMSDTPRDAPRALDAPSARDSDHIAFRGGQDGAVSRVASAADSGFHDGGSSAQATGDRPQAPLADWTPDRAPEQQPPLLPETLIADDGLSGGALDALKAALTGEQDGSDQDDEPEQASEDGTPLLDWVKRDDGGADVAPAPRAEPEAAPETDAAADTEADASSPLDLALAEAADAVGFDLIDEPGDAEGEAFDTAGALLLDTPVVTPVEGDESDADAGCAADLESAEADTRDVADTRETRDNDAEDTEAETVAALANGDAFPADDAEGPLTLDEALSVAPAQSTLPDDSNDAANLSSEQDDLPSDDAPTQEYSAEELSAEELSAQDDETAEIGDAAATDHAPEVETPEAAVVDAEDVVDTAAASAPLTVESEAGLDAENEVAASTETAGPVESAPEVEAQPEEAGTEQDAAEPAAEPKPLYRPGERAGRAAVPLTLVKAMMRGGLETPSQAPSAADAAPSEAPLAPRRLRSEDEPPQADNPQPGAPAEDDPEALAAAAEARAQRKAEMDAFIASNSIGALFIGARATLGKHDLKAVERDLRIKARYLEAIESIDPDGLPLDAYLPGYVKAYARYLQSELPLGPEAAYEKFRKELDAKLSAMGRAPKPARMAGPAEEVARDPRVETAATPRTLDPMSKIRQAARGPERPGVDPASARKAASNMAGRIARARAMARHSAEQGGAPTESLTRRMAPAFALVAAIFMLGGAGYGLWSVLAELQQVSAPRGDASRALRVIERPDVGSDMAVASISVERPSAAVYGDGSVMTSLYQSRPAEAPTPLETPTLATPPAPEGAPAEAQVDGAADTAEEGQADAADAETTSEAAATDTPPAPVATPPAPRERPDASALRQEAARLEAERAAAQAATRSVEPQRAAGPAFGLFAIADTWLRVRDRRGRELISGILAAGATASLPADRGSLQVRVGNAGGVAFVVDGQRYGPIGASGSVEELWIGPSRIPDSYPVWRGR